MQIGTLVTNRNNSKYAKCLEISKRIDWHLEKDVIRGRRFDFSKNFLPNGLSLIDQIDFLNTSEKRFVSQIQGRTYAYIFGLVERFIAAKVIQMSGERVLGDQIELESLNRFASEEIKHQEMFRRIENMLAERMPPGYVQVADPNEVAKAVLSKSTWSILALTCHIELFVLVHYKQSIAPDESLSELFRDIFRYHWVEESQHAILDELEWRRENEKLSETERDAAIQDLITLVGAVDGILQAQAKADTDYFLQSNERILSEKDAIRLEEFFLKAYRWQYILSGIQERKFQETLKSLVTPSQLNTIQSALSGLMQNA